MRSGKRRCAEKRELRKLKSEEERQSWILAVVKKKSWKKENARKKDKKSTDYETKEERIMVECG